MTNYNDGRWHGWNGGECPVHPNSSIAAIGYCGKSKHHTVFKNYDACSFDWLSFDGAFRVTKEHREPREWWVSPTYNDMSSSPVVGYVHVREVIE